MSALPIVAISVGDPNGIGVEVLLRAFQDNTLFEHCIPVVYADFPFMQAQQAYFGTQVPLQLLSGRPNKGVMNIKSVWEKSPEIDFGKQSTAAGTAAFKSLQAAALAVQQKKQMHWLLRPFTKPLSKAMRFHLLDTRTI